MEGSILKKVDVSYLDALLLDSTGRLKVVPADTYRSIPQEHLALYCYQKGFYGLPTSELIEWLKPYIVEGKTIEVGAGNGALGRALDIPITDSCLMRKPDVALYYALNKQPITTYPDDIIEMDALQAIGHYKPDVVIGSWVTHKYVEEEHWRGGNMYGLDEEFILSKVKKYIVIGHTVVHQHKKIMDRKHQELSFPWVFSRSMNVAGNRIFIW